MELKRISFSALEIEIFRLNDQGFTVVSSKKEDDKIVLLYRRKSEIIDHRQPKPIQNVKLTKKPITINLKNFLTIFSKCINESLRGLSLI